MTLQLNFDWATAGYLFYSSLYKLRDFLMVKTHDNVVVKRVLTPSIRRKTLDGKVRFRTSSMV